MALLGSNKCPRSPIGKPKVEGDGDACPLVEKPVRVYWREIKWHVRGGMRCIEFKKVCQQCGGKYTETKTQSEARAEEKRQRAEEKAHDKYCKELDAFFGSVRFTPIRLTRYVIFLGGWKIKKTLRIPYFYAAIGKNILESGKTDKNILEKMKNEFKF